MSRSSGLFLVVFAISTTLHAQARIDGDWWHGTNSETRRGVVNGAFDCLEANHGAKLPRLTVPVLDKKIDVAFAQSRANKTLADVLLELPKESGPGAPGGEDYSKEKHGWFDGDYWGSAPDDERSGFLIGYLSCGSTLHISIARIKTYRDKIDLWYDEHPSSNAKIADVIARVRHRNEKSTPPGSK